jgi:lysophospholipase L1-like esterase
MTRRRWAALAAVLLAIGAAGAGWYLQPGAKERRQLAQRMAGIAQASPGDMVDCAAVARERPLVLLALGQSNAGNHGSAASAAQPPVLVQAGAGCARVQDPLPGGTGQGGSVWRHLPALLQAGDGRAVLLSVLGVDGSSIRQWTDTEGPIAQRLEVQLAQLRAMGLQPDAVLWQQGEADARDATSARAYRDQLVRLDALLHGLGVDAPVFLALSTVCRSPPYAPVREAIAQATASTASTAAPGRLRPGPDTDRLVAAGDRRDGCHFSATGAQAAARAWAEVLGDYRLQHAR